MDIQIKKGDYGVSWAIKRQLQEEGVNTININSCWTDIMNAFKDDKESKVNNQTIGEKWTSLQSKVDCAVGQVIHIAEATWAKIKNVVLKAVGKTGGIGGTKRTTGKKASEVKAETITKDQCRETDAKGIWYCEKTGKHYKEVNGKIEEIKPLKKGGRITQFFKDGSHTERFDESGKDYTIRKYDKNGKIIIETKYRDGKPYKTSSNNDEEHGFYQKDRYHASGKNRVNLFQKKLPNGDFIVFQRDDSNGYTGYKRLNSNYEFLYNCDKDGNRIK